MYWNEEIETMDAERLRALQDERLREQVRYTYDRVPFYKKMFDEAGAQPGDIRTAKDLEKLPFTSKTDLRDNYPYGLLAVPMEEIVRIHASSGTTGKATVVGYTAGDLALWDECVARALTCAGGARKDIIQVCYGYGLFTGGLGLHGGAERIGATVIPASTGNTARQITMLQDYGSTMLCCTPSYALYLGEMAHKMEIDFSKIKLRLGLFGGEGHTDEMRKKIEELWHMDVTENYGLSEVIGPGYSGECYKHTGMHIAEDNFVSEIVDEKTLEPLPVGEKGELVVTSLTKEAFPVLRYRTKDITWFDDAPCPCGRTSMRMAKIQGRTDDMLVIRGVNVFPSQIEGVVMAMDEVEPYYEIVVTTEGSMDRIEVKVEVANERLLDNFAELEKLREKVRHNLRVVLNIDAKVTLVSSGSLQRFQGKAKHVTDLRKK